MSIVTQSTAADTGPMDKNPLCGYDFQVREVARANADASRLPGALLHSMLAETKPWRENLVELLAKQSRGVLMAESVLLVALIGMIDYVTGYEVTIFPFYSLPILFAMWFMGRSSAVLMAVLSTFAWWLADTASMHPYSQEWLQIWDAIVRLMFFLLVIVSGSAVREQRDANRARIQLMERTQKLEYEIVGISEREQQRIGRDLHDGLGQYLVAVGMAASSLKDDLEKESLRGSAEVSKIADLIHGATIRIRDLARGLSPVDRDAGGLEMALEELASSASQFSGVPCSFICDGAVVINDDEQAVHLFRIAQEALNNSIKHAQPKLIVIVLEGNNGALSLRVSDDGIGVASANGSKGGMGFNIMRYRALQAGGVLEIQPNSPTGTVVSCSISGKQTTSSNQNPTNYE